MRFIRRYRYAILLAAAVQLSAAVSQAPNTKTFHDPAYKLSFEYPADWTFSQRDHEISTFHLDARSAPRNAIMRAVVAMPVNPFPHSTFSGAYVYFSVTPHSSQEACDQQALGPPNTATSPKGTSKGGNISFAHGHDSQQEICVTQRDEVYTTWHRGACYRFDLAINNFCGGQVTGVQDLSDKELEQVNQRLESILATARFGLQ